MSEHQFSKPLDGRGLELDDPMRVGVKAGGWDDAIHIVKCAGDERTLCDQDAASRNVISHIAASTLGGMAGCWTCLHARDALASPRKLHESEETDG